MQSIRTDSGATLDGEIVELAALPANLLSAITDNREAAECAPNRRPNRACRGRTM